jgi:hypothetical protein
VSVERVVIEENWATQGHRIWVIGRAHPGAPTALLQAPAPGDLGPRWETLYTAAATQQTTVPTIDLPAGALDALVAAARGVQAPHPATERHLDDAVAVRDRLLGLVEGLVPARNGGTAT